MPSIPSQLLSEHQAAPIDPPANLNYNPTEEEQAAIKLVDQLYSDSKKVKAGVTTDWLENYKFYRGKQWHGRRPSYRASEVLNYIYSEVQTVLVLLTDSRPRIEILGEDPTDYDFAQIIDQVIKSKWDAKNYLFTLSECITDAAIYGTAVASVLWKPELEQGLGDYTFQSADPFYQFPDPDTKSAVNDEYCGYWVTAEPVDVKKLKAKYPDKADFIRADLSDVGLTNHDKELINEIKYQSPTDNRVTFESQQPRPGRPNQVLELCAYLKSDEMESVEIEGEIDPDTGLAKKLYQSKKKYPNGRKIVTANGVLLEDGPNPYDDAKFPYARLVDNALPREFWGIGEVENLKSPQRIVNKLISYLLDVLNLMGNPIWIVDKTAGVDTDNIVNQPGIVYEKNPGTEMRREQGVGVPPFVMETLQFMANNVMQKLSAAGGDVSRGVAPSANSSGDAIQSLQEAAQTKIRGKSRNVEMFLKDVGDLMVSRILQFYTVPRMVRLTSNEESAKYFKFVIDERVDEAGEITKIAEVVEYAQDPVTGQYLEQAPRQIPLKSRLDVRVNVGSALPFAKAENKAMAERLFDKHVIDTEELLTQIEYPHKERVLERLRKQAEMQMMQPPQGAMNGNAGPGPTAPSAA